MEKNSEEDSWQADSRPWIFQWVSMRQTIEQLWHISLCISILHSSGCKLFGKKPCLLRDQCFQVLSPGGAHSCHCNSSNVRGGRRQAKKINEVGMINWIYGAPEILKLEGTSGGYLVQPLLVSSFHAWTQWGDHPSLLQSEQSQLSQPVFTRDVLSSLTILVALCCNLSTMSLSLLYCGAQNWTLHATYSFINSE